MIARESAYGLLVIWHKIQSPRPTSASTTAGRSFDRDKSLNGNRTSTMAPAADGTTPRPPLAVPNLSPRPARLAKPFRLHPLSALLPRWSQAPAAPLEV